MKKLISLLIILSFSIESTGISYAQRTVSTDTLRPVAAVLSGENRLDKIKSSDFWQEERALVNHVDAKSTITDFITHSAQKKIGEIHKDSTLFLRVYITPLNNNFKMPEYQLKFITLDNENIGNITFYMKDNKAVFRGILVQSKYKGSHLSEMFLRYFFEFTRRNNLDSTAIYYQRKVITCYLLQRFGFTAMKKKHKAFFTRMPDGKVGVFMEPRDGTISARRVMSQNYVILDKKPEIYRSTYINSEFFLTDHTVFEKAMSLGSEERVFYEEEFSGDPSIAIPKTSSSGLAHNVKEPVKILHSNALTQGQLIALAEFLVREKIAISTKYVDDNEHAAEVGMAYIDRLKGENTPENKGFFVAFDKTEPVGIAPYSINQGYGRIMHAALEDLYVEPSHTNNHIGTQLFEAVKDYARNLGARDCTILIADTKKAQDFWKKKIPPEYQIIDENGILWIATIPLNGQSSDSHSNISSESPLVLMQNVESKIFTPKTSSSRSEGVDNITKTSPVKSINIRQDKGQKVLKELFSDTPFNTPVFLNTGHLYSARHSAHLQDHQRTALDLVDEANAQKLTKFEPVFTNNQLRVVLVGALLEVCLKYEFAENILLREEMKLPENTAEVLISFDTTAPLRKEGNPIELFSNKFDMHSQPSPRTPPLRLLSYLPPLRQCGFNFRIYNPEGKIECEEIFDDSGRMKVVIRLFSNKEDLIDYLRRTIPKPSSSGEESGLSYITAEHASSIIDEINKAGPSIVFGEDIKKKIVAKIGSMRLSRGKKALVVGPGGLDYFPILLAKLGIKTIAIDIDKNAVNSMKDLCNNFSLSDEVNIVSEYKSIEGEKFDFIFMLAVLNTILSIRAISVIRDVDIYGSEQEKEQWRDGYRLIIDRVVREIVNHLNPDGGMLFANDVTYFSAEDVRNNAFIPILGQLLYGVDESLKGIEVDMGVKFIRQPIDIDNFTMTPMEEERKGVVYTASLTANSKAHPGQSIGENILPVRRQTGLPKPSSSGANLVESMIQEMESVSASPAIPVNATPTAISICNLSPVLMATLESAA